MRHTLGPRVSIVVPVLNEALKARFVLRQLPTVHEVIVVDAGSTDGTPRLVREAVPGAVVLSHVGATRAEAIATGVAHASGDIVATLPINGTVDPATLPLLIDALVEGADVAKGSRFLPGAGSAEATLMDSLASLIVAAVARRRTGVELTDASFGYLAFWADQRPLLALGERPAWTDGDGPGLAITLRAARAGASIVEIPVVERHRLFGARRARGLLMLARRVRAAQAEIRLPSVEPVRGPALEPIFAGVRHPALAR